MCVRSIGRLGEVRAGLGWELLARGGSARHRSAVRRRHVEIVIVILVGGCDAAHAWSWSRRRSRYACGRFSRSGTRGGEAGSCRSGRGGGLRRRQLLAHQLRGAIHRCSHDTGHDQHGSSGDQNSGGRTRQPRLERGGQNVRGRDLRVEVRWPHGGLHERRRRRMASHRLKGAGRRCKGRCGPGRRIRGSRRCRLRCLRYDRSDDGNDFAFSYCLGGALPRRRGEVRG